jgi:hypothetical protein
MSFQKITTAMKTKAEKRRERGRFEEAVDLDDELSRTPETPARKRPKLGPPDNEESKAITSYVPSPSVDPVSLDVSGASNQHISDETSVMLKGSSGEKTTTRHVITPFPSVLSFREELSKAKQRGASTLTQECALIVIDMKEVPTKVSHPPADRSISDLNRDDAVHPTSKHQILSSIRASPMAQHDWKIHDPSTIKDEAEAMEVRQKPHFPKKRNKRFLMSIVFVILVLPKLIGMMISWHSAPIIDGVYVPGGGFSGFWMTLGRLRSIPNPTEKEYYCYSAGCLGVVATLGNYSMEEMYDIAKDAQVQWQNGKIHRHDVVGHFLDALLFSNSSDRGSAHELHRRLLSKIHIITSIKNGRFGMAADIRTPTSVEGLHTMLLQTTWIPFAVGGQLWHLDHMDGAFTIEQHPVCTHEVGSSLSLDVVANFVNMNLSWEKVEKFWEMGVRTPAF